jgi:hypothetical protein
MASKIQILYVCETLFVEPLRYQVFSNTTKLRDPFQLNELHVINPRNSSSTEVASPSAFLKRCYRRDSLEVFIKAEYHICS